ncbi:Leucine-rich repeat receptor-like protein kinase TDR [Hibiscus syriacus]|uniref:non-specific serine/threonine protein kinase n=1 Tax=Hibiscus syriacus TaxID=106335 RepID=A0A6A2Z9L2_HIBSY|nr:Leucine-rich repeat receptor-like protein kinase TDR [Hibiscus syriacus]
MRLSSELAQVKSNNYIKVRCATQVAHNHGTLTELTWLSLIDNNLSGTIPQGIGELPNLDPLLLWDNNFSGILPEKLGSNGKLMSLEVSSNSLTGPIPQNLCHGNKLFKQMFTHEVKCTSLSRFRIQNNLLNGEIPRDLGHTPLLQYLNISENSFDDELPNNIWSSPSLQIFSASSSKLIGKIPDFVCCNNVYKIELQGNLLNGSIPSDIDHCQKLLSLSLSRNRLTRMIPSELSSLPSINSVDLSCNLLTGTIPSSFENCNTLENFNVSYNLLSGPIPSSGPTFRNLQPSSFSGNDGLCGTNVSKPCPGEAMNTGELEAADNKQPKKTSEAIVWIVAAALCIFLFVLVAVTRCLHYSHRSSDDREIGPWKLTAFQRLNFTADDVLECLSMTDEIIGMGSTGTVYKAEMPGGEIIAVKKLWEYMPNGNLDDLLHGNINKGDNLVVDWVTRHKIALGVAQGICYLHNDCDLVIVHRNFKPSKILLDGEMEARVADFGVAKLIQGNDYESMSICLELHCYVPAGTGGPAVDEECRVDAARIRAKAETAAQECGRQCG